MSTQVKLNVLIHDIPKGKMKPDYGQDKWLDQAIILYKPRKLGKNIT